MTHHYDHDINDSLKRMSASLEIIANNLEALIEDFVKKDQTAERINKAVDACMKKYKEVPLPEVLTVPDQNKLYDIGIKRSAEIKGVKSDS